MRFIRRLWPSKRKKAPLYDYFGPKRYPAAKIYKYHDNWQTERVTCPVCSWTGVLGEQGLNIEGEDGVGDVCCPRCDKMLAVVG